MFQAAAAGGELVQVDALEAGDAADFSAGFFTAKYDPATDSSMSGSPKVFVN